MKTVLLYILLITAFFSCDNEQKEKEKQIDTATRKRMARKTDRVP